MSTELFDHAAEQLERHTDLDRLEARGTLRLAVKQAGLDSESLSFRELKAVFENIMPAELEARGIDNTATTCTTIFEEITRTADASTTEETTSVDDIFKRLGGA
jgi:hypothetical protein